ncbi:MAG: hypothetical protein RLZZ546_3364, partial [Bacteroidota bacterium]
KEGNQKYKFADKRLGNIANIDASNPLNILIYFSDFNVVKILDNTLAEIKQISLNDYFIGAEKICMSNDNNFWIHDKQSMKFLKINHSGEILFETNVLNDIGLADFLPIKIKEKDNLFFALGEEKLLVFDNFGQLNKIILVKEALDFQYGNNKILILSKNNVEMVTMDLVESFKVPMPKVFNQELAKSIKLETDRWYFLYEQGIDWIKR